MPALLTRSVAPIRRLYVRLRTGLARTPLRLRLVAALVAVVIVALGGAGAATAATLQTYLTARIDTQLRSVEPQIAEHQISAVTGSGDGGGRSGRGDGGSGLPSAYVLAVNDSTGREVLGPVSYLVDPGQPLPHFPDFTGDETKRAGTRYLTTFAEHGDESWRLLATPVTLADGSTGTLMIAQSLSDVQNTVNRLTVLLAVIGAGAVVVLAGVGYLIVRASLRPLREVERTAAYVAAGDLSHRVPTSHDRTEVGQLSVALNTMLGEIETAFAARARSEEAARRSEQQLRVSEATARQSEDRMRRFVADASHELRTPLTSIRGFAELYRQGAASSPPDIRKIMNRIESEAQRMGLLVEDLLLLARLDRERPIGRAPVDLLALATDAVHDAQATAPDRPITLAVDPAGGPPVVLGDELRLRQVVANLMTNALRHTPAGTPVRVRLASRPPASPADAGTAVFEVADDGPGLSPEQSARVFERFYRADTARGSDGGAGLGLAIVSALVAGHDGTVEVHSEPGAGACFRVTLALARVDSDAV